MRVKLGPYKVTQDLWMRMQQLPGDNDEQRVLLAIDAACVAIERAQAKADVARHVEQAERVGNPEPKQVTNVLAELVEQQGAA